MTGANFSVTGGGGAPHSKLHHPNSITLFMPVVDTASCDWRHALHRLIGILNWKTAGERCKYHHPENCHAKTMNKNVNSSPNHQWEMITIWSWQLSVINKSFCFQKQLQSTGKSKSCFRYFSQYKCYKYRCHRELERDKIRIPTWSQTWEKNMTRDKKTCKRVYCRSPFLCHV